MTKSEILTIVKRNMLEVIPELESSEIDPQQSMKDLGYNSIDRADVVLQSMEQLNVKVPLHELGRVKSIQGLVDFLYDKVEP